MRVLSIDGGGNRGLLPARVLVELESITARPIAELFDVIAGTSTGAILALALTTSRPSGRAPHTAEDLFDLFVTRGRELMPGGWPARWRARMPGRGRFRGAIDQLSEVPDTIGSIAQRRHPIEELGRWASEPLTHLLHEYLGDTPLGQAHPEVIVPTFDLNAAQPLIFHSREFARYSVPLMRDVARASSATPTRLPPVRMEFGGVEHALVHGGLASNNPAIFGYGAALSRAPAEEISVVSLGAGTPAPAGTSTRAAFAPRRRGWPRGSRRAFSAFMHTSGDAQHQMLHRMLSGAGHDDRYWRIQTSLDGSSAAVGIPEGADIEGLRLAADEMLEQHRPEIDQIAAELVQ